MNIPEKQARSRGYGPYCVSIIDNVQIPMTDNTKLSAKLWFPQDASKSAGVFTGATNWYVFYKPQEPATDSHYPTVLEYLPYRKNDWTAERDHLRHPWMASHGYVVIRVDIRGSGESQGLIHDEYMIQEQEDCNDVIKWIARQPWSNEAVGMYGKSWGGFNGLQVAYTQPKHLKAVISLYSSNDRYALDTPHDGGCVTGDALISWGSYMFGWNARAPDPRVVKDWKVVWRTRLEQASAPWASKWLRHELKDEYWKHGSISQNYQRVTCPVLAIGGWKDPYTDAVFRMVHNLPNVRGIVGPWPHEWPDTCTTGPNIEFLQLCLKWWDEHLKCKPQQQPDMDTPKLRVYLQDACVSPRYVPYRRGKWLALRNWPDPDYSQQMAFVLHDSHLVDEHKSSLRHDHWHQVPFNLQVGQNHGEWLDFGAIKPAFDQRVSDAHSLQFNTKPLVRSLSILGFPVLRCIVRVLNHDRGMLAARLNHVTPTGESTMITYGYINLTHIDGDEPSQVRLLETGAEYDVMLKMHSASYVIPEGHQLRLALSACYWPGTWPSWKQVDLELLQGIRADKPASLMRIPTVSDDVTTYADPLFNTTEPQISTPLPVEYRSKPDYSTQIITDPVENRIVQAVIHDTGLKHYPTLGVTLRHKFSETYHVITTDPLSAVAKTEHENVAEYPEKRDDESGEPIRIRVLTRSQMTADKAHFYVNSHLTCLLNDREFYKNSWKDVLDRKYV